MWCILVCYLILFNLATNHFSYEMKCLGFIYYYSPSTYNYYYNGLRTFALHLFGKPSNYLLLFVFFSSETMLGILSGCINKTHGLCIFITHHLVQSLHQYKFVEKYQTFFYTFCCG